MEERRNLTERPVEERVSSLESSMSHIEKDVRDIKTSISAGFLEIHNRISTNANDNKFHPSTWIAAAGVIILLLSLIGNSYIKDLDRIDRTQVSLSSRTVQLEKRIQGITYNSNSIRALDTITQRDINHRYDEIDNRLEHIEEKFDTGDK